MILLLGSVYLSKAYVVLGGYLGFLGLSVFYREWRPKSLIFFLLPACLFMAAHESLPALLLGEGFYLKRHFGAFSELREMLRVRLDEFVYRSQEAGDFISAFMISLGCGFWSSCKFLWLGC